MYTFRVISNLRATRKMVENAIKSTTNKVVIDMHKVKLKALDQAIEDQKELKTYGGVQNLIDLAKKGLGKSTLFNELEE